MGTGSGMPVPGPGATSLGAELIGTGPGPFGAN